VSDEFIPLARPAIGPREEERVLEVLRSRQLSLGPRLGEFEQAIAARVGAAHVSAVSSGTAGLHLALRAAGIEAGDEVLTTPFSFVASANSILYENARPVFCDIDRRTLNLDPAAAADAISDRTSGILPVHIFGYPADMPAFERLAGERGLWIVEDACEALGAAHGDGVPVGGRGHAAVFAFYPNKQVATGEGGAVVCPDEKAKARIDSERNQGRAPDMGWLDHDRLGFNYRLSDVACALGLAQMERLDELLGARARVAEWYGERLADAEGLELPCPDGDGDRRSWFVYVVQLPSGVDRDETIERMRASGIDAKPYLPAIHLMSFYRERFGHKEGEFPVCEEISRRSLALPFFPELSEGQVERVSETLVGIIQSSAHGPRSTGSRAATRNS
jgi:perosamine synthetase